jgi:hypothetical protein
MDATITDKDRATMVRAAVARLGRDELREALARTSDPRFQAPKAVGNAINALRRHRDPAGVLGKVQYRAVIPYVAAAASDTCLTRTIEVLGDASDDPTREQLLTAIDELDDEFTVATVAVMLASVADADMASSDLCFDLLATSDRFGLTEWGEVDAGPVTRTTDPLPAGGATPEQREARRAKKQKDAEDRRRKLDAARRAGEEARRARKKDRSSGSEAPRPTPGPTTGVSPSAAPRLTRRALLTPDQEAEFDRHDPWAAGVVFAWVPFDQEDPAAAPTAPTAPGIDGQGGKIRPCVVVAGSATHLLVRPGYSEGGAKSRDWKSVPLAHWRRSGFGRPTWIDIAVLRVQRDQVDAPVGWLSGEDWNAIW